MAAHNHVVLLLLPMNVQSSSACKLNDFEVAQHPLVEALRRCRDPLEPSRDGMAGMARDPGGRRNAHTCQGRSKIRPPWRRKTRPSGRGVAPPASIAIVDDVLTTGAHFRAASTVLAVRFPTAQIVGLFIARRVPDADSAV